MDERGKLYEYTPVFPVESYHFRHLFFLRRLSVRGAITAVHQSKANLLRSKVSVRIISHNEIVGLSENRVFFPRISS